MQKSFGWPLLGLLVISIAVGFSFLYDSLWIGYFTALASAVLILLFMTRSMVSEIDSISTKRTIGILFLVLSILTIYNSVFEWTKAQFRSDNLTEIRQTIDGSIAQMEAEQVLIETLRHHYLNKTDDASNLEQSFDAVAGERINPDGTLAPSRESRGESLTYYINVMNSDSVAITVVADILAGDNPEFRNVDDQKGMYQGLAVLTAKGVHYVRQN